jgi:hypothetical protein
LTLQALERLWTPEGEFKFYLSYLPLLYQKLSNLFNLDAWKLRKIPSFVGVKIKQKTDVS